jgi:hypothetical protein
VNLEAVVAAYESGEPVPPRGTTTIWVGGVQKSEPMPTYTFGWEKLVPEWKKEEGEGSVVCVPFPNRSRLDRE